MLWLEWLARFKWRARLRPLVLCAPQSKNKLLQVKTISPFSVVMVSLICPSWCRVSKMFVRLLRHYFEGLTKLSRSIKRLKKPSMKSVSDDSVKITENVWKNQGFLKTDHGRLCTPDLVYCFFELVSYSFQRESIKYMNSGRISWRWILIQIF